MSDRISWEEYALRIAEVASYRSEDPYTKVGACALDFSNRVIGVAFMIHAEINLLSLFKRGECNLLACTLLPCSCCAISIVAHGIKKIVYKQTYFRDTQALEIFKFNDIECKQIFF